MRPRARTRAALLRQPAEKLPSPQGAESEGARDRRVPENRQRDEAPKSRPPRLLIGRYGAAPLRSGKPPDREAGPDKHYGVGRLLEAPPRKLLLPASLKRHRPGGRR